MRVFVVALGEIYIKQKKKNKQTKFCYYYFIPYSEQDTYRLQKTYLFDIHYKSFNDFKNGCYD